MAAKLSENQQFTLYAKYEHNALIKYETNEAIHASIDVQAGLAGPYFI
jgi:hypothetical protein